MTLDELCSIISLVLNSVTASLVLHVTVVPVTWEAETGDQEQATMCGQHTETHFKRKKKYVRKVVQVFWVTNRWKEKTVRGWMKWKGLRVTCCLDCPGCLLHVATSTELQHG